MKRITYFIVLIAIITLVGGSASPVTSGARGQGAYVEPALLSEAGKVSVIVTAGDSQAASRAVQQVGGQVTSDLWLINAVGASIPADRLQLLATYPGVQSVVQNKGVQAAGETFFDGYVTNRRVQKATFTLVSTQYKPVVYLSDGGFVSVSDKGIGIPADEVLYIFEKYRRGSFGKKESGSGLGLFIVRSIVEAHGGKIWVESAPGKGSVFRFTLPLFKQGT